MDLKKHPVASKLLHNFLSSLKRDLAENLIAVYLYGSLATGDFVDELSDIDLLIVMKNKVNLKQLNSLADLHQTFNSENNDWSKRVDVAYLSEGSIKNIKDKPYQTIVSDGHGGIEIVHAPEYYLIDWYKVQEQSVTLFGPDAGKLMPRISIDEFKEVVRCYMLDWPDKAAKADKRGLQAYIVVTLCRSLYAYKYGKHVSKRIGANWVVDEFPQWSSLIRQSLKWSRDSENSDVVDTKNKDETIQFMNFMLSRI